MYYEFHSVQAMNGEMSRIFLFSDYPNDNEACPQTSVFVFRICHYHPDTAPSLSQELY